MDGKRTRASRVTRWSALLVVGTFVVLGCRPEEATPEPTEAAATPVATVEVSTVPILATIEPSAEPTATPTVAPTPEPTLEPTPSPTPEPTLEPTPSPTPEPTLEPTPSPTVAPASPSPVVGPAPVASASAVADGMVTGTVVLPSGVTLPEGAVISVDIEDVTIANAPAEVIAEATPAVSDPTAVEIPYEIAYDPAAIEETKTYSVRARIEDVEGVLLYVSDTVTPVITRDAPKADVELPVVPVLAATPAASVDATAMPAPAGESAAP